MAQKGVKCVRGKIPHEECRQCALSGSHPCMFTPDLLEKMRDKPGDRHTNPDIASPSTLTDCDRKYALVGEADTWLDVDAAYAALRGSLIHESTATLDYPGAVDIIRETEMMTYVETTYGRKKIMGKADLIVIKEVRDGIAYAKVVDYKTKGQVSHQDIAPSADHVMQINVYKWLIETGVFLDKRGKAWKYKYPIVVDELELMYLGYNKPRRFTSETTLQTTGKILNRATGEKETLELGAIQLLPLDVIGQWVSKRAQERQTAIHREPLPPPLEGDAAWRCSYCPVRNACFDLADQRE